MKLSFLISVLCLAVVLPTNLTQGTYVERVMHWQHQSGADAPTSSLKSQTDVRASSRSCAC